MRNNRVVLLVGGQAGVGKTTLARHIARRVPAAIVDKDSVTRPLVDALMTELTGDAGDRQSTEYLSKVRYLEYACIMNTAMDIARHGTNVVAVAPFLKELTDPEWIRQFKARCESAGRGAAAVWVECSSPDEHLRRITERGAERDAWKLDNWSQFRASLDIRPHHSVARLDNSVHGFAEMEALSAHIADSLFAEDSGSASKAHLLSLKM